MTLDELFVSHKQVDPVEFEFKKPSLPQPIYLNLDRAQQVTATNGQAQKNTAPDIPEEDMKNWKVSNLSDLDWKVSSHPSSSKQSTKQSSKPYSGTPTKVNSERAQYWMQKFANLGADTNQQIAIVSAMVTECGLNPRGSVEKKELAGQGNTKAGWAHAGEGAVGFTHWDLKQKLIKQFNNDPRRKGKPLPTSEQDYAKNNARHISDLDDDDQALITAIFYQNLLNKTKGMNFDDRVGEFYMEKAGRGFGQRKGAGNTPYEKAVYTGKVYQQSHAKLGYHNAAKTNTFLKSLDYAKGLANQLGYTI